MGYTHYWYRPPSLPSDAWEAFVRDWRVLWRALKRRGLALDGGSRNSSGRIPQEVNVNGVGPAAHEEFFLSRLHYDPSRAKANGRCFDFCKTARKLYDLAVTASLVVAKRHFGSLLTVCSDGNAEDWRPAKLLCQEVLGYGADTSLPEPSTAIGD